MLLLRRAQLEAEVQDRHTQLERVAARLRMIESENEMLRDDVVVRSLAQQRVAAVSYPAPGFGADNLESVLGPGIVALYEILAANEVSPAGPPFSFYEGDPNDGTLVANVAFPVDEAVCDLPAPARLIDLPAVDEAACVLLPAPGRTTHAEVYGELCRWIGAHGYEPDGHGRDVFLNTEAPRSEADVIMEIQWPLRKR